MGFQKATKKKSKLRLTFDGPAGSGKTFSSLLLAKNLGGRVALLDSERGSASKYANLFEFDTDDVGDFSPNTYVKKIEEAKGYDVLIIDSLSHAWVGALEIVDREKDKFGSGWRKVTPMHNKLVDAILTFPGHVITTMRSKMAYEQEKDANGKTVIRKLGLAPIQREGMEYEFDVIADLTIDGNINVTKTRCPSLRDLSLNHNDVPRMADLLKAWLSDGVEAPAVAAQTTIAKLTEKLDEIGFEPLSAEEKILIRLEECSTLEQLAAVYNEIKPSKELIPLFTKRKAELANGP